MEFNPAEVASYHLIGYEQQMPGKEGLNRNEIDAGEIDAGHSVTAFYEVVPAEASANRSGDDAADGLAPSIGPIRPIPPKI